MVTVEEFEAANTRAESRAAATPRADSARYDSRTHRVMVQLSSKLGIFFSPDEVQGLEGASAEQLRNIEISPTGFGLHFPALDADIYLPAILDGKFGSERWMADRAKSTEDTQGRKKVVPGKANGGRRQRPAM